MKKCNVVFLFLVIVANLLNIGGISAVAAEASNGLNKISVGVQHLLILGKDQSVWSAGSNTQGQLGRPTASYTDGVGQIPSLSNAVDVAAGNLSSLVLTSDSTIFQWRGTDNQPNKITSIRDAIDVEAGASHGVALTREGKVWTWGSNYVGQLGIGSNSSDFSLLTPVQVPNLSDVIEIAAKGDTTLALKKDGTVWGWGSNSYYQFGNGTQQGSNVPIQIVLPRSIKHIYLGTTYVGVIDDQDNVWAWGINSSGQLGDGTQVNRPLPIQIEGLKSIKQLALGNTFGMGLKQDGSMLSWGSNINGQLGDETNVNHLSPSLVHGINKVDSISAGSATSMAVTENSEIFIWGRLMTDAKGGTSNKPVKIEINDSPKQIEPLVAPQALKIKVLNGTSIKLSWDQSLEGNEMLAGYNIYQNDVLVGTTTETNYIINTLNPKMEYTFTIRARDKTGNVSDPSNSVKKKASKQYTYVYNSAGRLISITYESGKKIVYTYDKNGNLIKTTIINP
ncbi:fibronectin type III domain-containing protein [Paenibacillus sp. JX-17]|uniref:Fibronectin type III domain-containing protein n=1 Tax=Paenibacillus lacisoli TaxID=3064525 RepID=A0ABT9C8G8_9BACL|nr:fibronectin type III domain-containing protein [Paenibacillus sp. JX-17]MDO7905534.1 fibronectin type III domain-containing protein [Paenibacillus sp. JX-17]